MSEYQSFLHTLQKRGSKPHKISHCYGSRDAWKWVRKNKWKSVGGIHVSQSLYSSIIDKVHLCLIDMLLEGHSIEFPHQMGILKIIRTPSNPVFKDGKLLDNYRTDWLKTLKLWYEDSEAKNNHQLVKRPSSFIYSIKYSKPRAVYRNKMFYKFRANRSLVRKLGHSLEQRSVQAEDVSY